MAKLPLSFACWNYDRTRALMDGSVQVDGIDLNYLNLPVEETFFRMARFREFDVCEMSLSSYCVSLHKPDRPFIAIPVFPSRFFRHSCIYVNANSGINEPKDLIGKPLEGGLRVADFAQGGPQGLNGADGRCLAQGVGEVFGEGGQPIGGAGPLLHQGGSCGLQLFHGAGQVAKLHAHGVDLRLDCYLGCFGGGFFVLQGVDALLQGPVGRIEGGQLASALGGYVAQQGVDLGLQPGGLVGYCGTGGVGRVGDFGKRAGELQELCGQALACWGGDIDGFDDGAQAGLGGGHSHAQICKLAGNVGQRLCRALGL